MEPALDLAFAALSDATRRDIVDRLTKGTARVTDLARPFDMSLNAVSKHVKALEHAGLVRRTRAGREHHIALDPKPIQHVARWAFRYERFWNDRLDKLEALLDTKHKERATMTSPEKTPTTQLLRITVPRRIEATPEEVFDAWAEPHLFERWFEPHRAIFRKAAVDELWYWEADHAGRLWAHYCRYLRVQRPRLLEFTWMSEATRGLESRVMIELTPSRGGTDLVLTHSGLPDDEMGRGHEEGWKTIIGILADKIQGLRS